MKLYIIAGPNGAGKTTASYTILPEIFKCKDFINADEIARGLSPFDPDSVAIQAGRIMLHRINELLTKNITFALETTLAAKSYIKFIEKAQKQGYEVILLFLSLNSEELAIKRVENRVKEGGHNIPIDVIKRRYTNGLHNFFRLYKQTVDKWLFVDNSGEDFHFIAEGSNMDIIIKDEVQWEKLKRVYND